MERTDFRSRVIYKLEESFKSSPKYKIVILSNKSVACYTGVTMHCCYGNAKTKISKILRFIIEAWFMNLWVPLNQFDRNHPKNNYIRSSLYKKSIFNLYYLFVTTICKTICFIVITTISFCTKITCLNAYKSSMKQILLSTTPQVHDFYVTWNLFGFFYFWVGNRNIWNGISPDIAKKNYVICSYNDVLRYILSRGSLLVD